MALITTEQAAELASRGLKIEGSVTLGQLPHYKLHQPGLTKEQQYLEGRGHERYAYALKFKAPCELFDHSQIFNCVMGAYSYINASSTVSFCTMGNYCSLGKNLYIGLPQHCTSSVSTSVDFCDEGDPFLRRWTHGHCLPYQLSTYYPITIGHDVWIGNNVTIPAARPISIGTGAILATQAVITHDVPPYAIVGGNPARIIKMRFSDELCADLLASQWYDYDLPGYEHCEELEFNDPKRFLERFAQQRAAIPKITDHYQELTFQ